MHSHGALDFSNLTPAQECLICLQGWRIGSKYPDGSIWPQPSKRTVKKLIERGLVVLREVTSALGNGMRMTVTEYEVPLHVHMAYCFQCPSAADLESLTPIGPGDV
ncbi:hypothetical protein [Orrella dioscoreae]|uniref:hypothetical protein n=1 Tax=Orrella dioscoreae TaxID=1851544 RepID=UPI00082C41B0|nr:hypothetical protein [Orrella dioscoreae]